jgi:hypothetical protein
MYEKINCCIRLLLCADDALQCINFSPPNCFISLQICIVKHTSQTRDQKTGRFSLRERDSGSMMYMIRSQLAKEDKMNPHSCLTHFTVKLQKCAIMSIYTHSIESERGKKYGLLRSNKPVCTVAV